MLTTRKKLVLVRTGFNRRAAAAARLKTSVMVEHYDILERAVAAIKQALVGFRMQYQPRTSMQGRFGTYQLRYERFNWGKTLGICVMAPSGRRLSAHVPHMGLEGLQC